MVGAGVSLCAAAPGIVGTCASVWQNPGTAATSRKAVANRWSFMTTSRDIDGIARFEPDVLLRIFALDHVLVVERQPGCTSISRLADHIDRLLLRKVAEPACYGN